MTKWRSFRLTFPSPCASSLKLESGCVLPVQSTEIFSYTEKFPWANGLQWLMDSSLHKQKSNVQVVSSGNPSQRF